MYDIRTHVVDEGLDVALYDLLKCGNEEGVISGVSLGRIYKTVPIVLTVICGIVKSYPIFIELSGGTVDIGQVGIHIIGIEGQFELSRRSKHVAYCDDSSLV